MDSFSSEGSFSSDDTDYSDAAAADAQDALTTGATGRTRSGISYYEHWPYQYDKNGKPRVTDQKPIRPGKFVIPRTTKPLSRFLEKFLNNENPGPPFQVDILMGQMEDPDYGDDKCANNWFQVAKVLKIELGDQRRIKKNRKKSELAYKAYKAYYDGEYKRGLVKAIREVKRYYL